jgi:hypothetical protein
MLGRGCAAGETLVAAGDNSNPPGGGRGDVATARVVEANQPTLVLALGDTQYERGQYRNFLAAYDRSWGRFKARTRPAVGNHEYMDPAGPAAGYFRYFGRRAGDPTRGYYSFDVGGWHAVALNSACGQAGAPSCGHGSPQRSWLKRDLAAHRQPCTVALFHHPYRSSAAPFTGKKELSHLWALLVAGGVDVVLNGHNHAYERLKVSANRFLCLAQLFRRRRRSRPGKALARHSPEGARSTPGGGRGAQAAVRRASGRSCRGATSVRPVTSWPRPRLGLPRWLVW